MNGGSQIEHVIGLLDVKFSDGVCQGRILGKRAKGNFNKDKSSYKPSIPPCVCVYNNSSIHLSMLMKPKDTLDFSINQEKYLSPGGAHHFNSHRAREK